MKLKLREHGATIALVALMATGVILRSGSPPDRPCDGGWVKIAAVEGNGCGDDDRPAYWDCPTDPPAVAERLPLAFEPNSGQAPGEYQFLARTRTLGVFLDDGDADLMVRGPDGKPASVRLHLEGSAHSPTAEGEGRLAGFANYLIGNDPNRWRTNIPSFSRVRYRDVYPGVDLVYYGNEGELEHDFVVRAGAHPAAIRMDLRGADSVQVEADGSASAIVQGLRVSWKRPMLYQNVKGRRSTVAGRYRHEGGNRLTFDVGSYDKSANLIIDPVVSYVSYFGRSGADAGGRLVVDSAGNAYTAGITHDGSFPVTPGAPFVNLGAHGDVLITKFNATGTAVLYSTHLGGANAEGATGIAIDSTGNLYLTGSTNSDDYPVSATALKKLLQAQGASNDPFDCFVTKLNAAGNSILYSTYLGGSRIEGCKAVAVDAQGSAYITGRTSSSNFPVTDEAIQRTARGGTDGFVTKLNAAGSALVYSTLFGGIGNEDGFAIAVDAQNNAYVTGYTASSFGFPITAGALQPAWGGTLSIGAPGDAFVLKLNPAGSQLVYSTYLGGSRDELGLGIAVDAQGSAYVTGYTNSTNFRTTEGAYQREFKGRGGNNLLRGGDAFAVKLNPAGNAFVYSTLLGGARDEWGTAIAVDAAGNAFITGATLSIDFPLSQDALQKTFGGSSVQEGFPLGDAFLSQLNAAGSALVYSTYIGGSADEFAFGLAVDQTGAVYVSGSTLSANLPVTPGAAQTTYGGSSRQVVPFGDVFVARFAGSGGASSNVQLHSIGSAASYAAGGVSPGEIAVLFGAGIGPANLTTLALAGDGKVSSTLASTRILFDETPAPLIYVSAGQSSAIVPYGVSGRSSTQVVVEYQGQRSAPLTMAVVAAKPALFSANGSGAGPGAILNEDSSVNTPANPSPRGRVIVLFGTGAGQTNPAGVDGLLATLTFPRALLAASVTIGGRTADVLYAGAAPGLVAGVFQINAKVPEDATPGNAETIVTYGSARSQAGLTVALR